MKQISDKIIPAIARTWVCNCECEVC